MNTEPLEKFVQKVFKDLEKRIAAYKESPEDWNISHGNVAICMITEEGNIYGKLFGDDKIRQRSFYKVAWQKASQVWITGHATGAYEEIVFGGTMDPEDSPIELPDLIGWVGGQPIELKDGTKLAIGFSGFRGFNDIAIVKEAIKKIEDEN